MIFNRLIDSFKDNFDKWSCIYPDLDAAVAAALGLVWARAPARRPRRRIGARRRADRRPHRRGGRLGLRRAARSLRLSRRRGRGHDPSGTARTSSRTFWTRACPAPIGLIYDRDIFHIGDSHQVVAYGYAVVGSQTQIYVYDNRLHDQECMLTVDTENPGKIVETLADGSALPGGNNGNWEGLLVSDGYQSQTPSYGQDIGIASPQALTLSGAHRHGADHRRRGASRRGSTASGRYAYPAHYHGAMPIAIAAQQQQLAGRRLVDSFAVQNFGEYQAHYQTLGIEIDAPDGGASFCDATAAGPNNLLAPGETLQVTIDVRRFGDAPGVYALRAGYNSVPLNAESPDWLTLFFPAALVTVT